MHQWRRIVSSVLIEKLRRPYLPAVTDSGFFKAAINVETRNMPNVLDAT